MTTRITSQPLTTAQRHASVPTRDAPLTHDDAQSRNLRSLLERTHWTNDCFYASNVPPSVPRSSEKWIFTSHNGSMFEGTWHRHTYAPNKLGGTEIIRSLRSRLSPARDETAVHWFGAGYRTVIDENMRARRESIIDWLARRVSLKKMPRPTVHSKEWRVAIIREGCAFTIIAWTDGVGGRIHKPLVRSQATLKGMEVLLFYDRPPSDFSRLMDREMGLVNLVILYFALMKFEPMPPPPLPLKAQELLRQKHEDEMDCDDSDSDPDDYSDSDED